MVLSHGHMDHFGGLLSLVERVGKKVKRFQEGDRVEIKEKVTELAGRLEEQLQK